MQLLDVQIAILLLFSVLSHATGEGSSVPKLVQRNLTAGSPSSSRLKQIVAHNFRQRGPGCWNQPWICNQGVFPPTRRCCRNRCVDVTSDINNCGLCGIRCLFARHCCRGLCINTNISPFNCGRCGNRCPFGVRCIYGMCGYAQPFPPWPFPIPTPRPRPLPQPPKLPPPPGQPKPPGGWQPPAMQEDL